MQDWEQADDTSNRILTSADPLGGNNIEATKVLVAYCYQTKLMSHVDGISK
jgi:hypothetical protein